jgi:hypothetical protein
VNLFEKHDLVLIERVDMNGFCGRDYHPTREDEGLVAEVVRVIEEEQEPLDVLEGLAPVVVLKCLTLGHDPRFIELMPHEVVLAIPVRLSA